MTFKNISKISEAELKKRLSWILGIPQPISINSMT
jgi:hypothetical protein